MKTIYFFLLIFALTFNSSAQPMVLVYDINEGSGTIVYLPLYGTVDVQVDWGDGSIDTYNTVGIKMHEYATNGIFTVSISGTLSRFGSQSYMEKENLIKCLSFGDIGLTDLSYAFENTRLNEVPNNLPHTVTNLERIFGYCQFNHDISGWDVTNVTNMSEMFCCAYYSTPPFQTGT